MTPVPACHAGSGHTGPRTSGAACLPSAPPAAAPGVPAPAANAQPEDTASAVAITIVVIFMTSVSVFMSKDKDCRRPSFQIGSINLSLAATQRPARPVNALLLASGGSAPARR
jgi:hypothetical protein